MKFFSYQGDEMILEQTYYSIGGGFIVQDCDFEK